MTETLGYEKYAAGGCDIGGLVSSQLGHKYADELYGIHIGSGLPLDFFTGPRAWDFARNRPLSDEQPADVRARIIELDRRSASHLAVHMLDGANDLLGEQLHRHLDALLRQRQPVPLDSPHDHGGHFIPWENPDAWVSDLRRTFRGRRP
jgi:pimeloyl-ACP methyl ester carboxylesterase